MAGMHTCQEKIILRTSTLKQVPKTDEYAVGGGWYRLSEGNISLLDYS